MADPKWDGKAIRPPFIPSIPVLGIEGTGLRVVVEEGKWWPFYTQNHWPPLPVTSLELPS